MRMRKLAAALLIVHLIVAGTLLVTMDMDLDNDALRRSCDRLIDAYELIGFGVMPVGIAIATCVLVVPLVRFRTRDRRDRAEP